MKNEQSIATFKTSEGAEVSVNLTNSKKAALVLRALNHPLRQKMLGLMDAQKGITVTEIYKNLRIEQSVASQHLGILRSASIVKTEREGKCIHYNINHERIQEVENYTKSLVG